MSASSKIEWTDASWNVVTGCTKVSPGCDRCYAETFAERWRGTPGHHFENGFDITIRPERLTIPFAWRKPKRIFVNSMSDVFHNDIPDDLIGDMFAVMSLTPHHIYQVLTKRHGRMRSLLNDTAFQGYVAGAAARMASHAGNPVNLGRWPIPNVHLGVSAEDQHWADIRIPALLDTPAAVRWISAEPLLGPVELRKHWVGVDALRPDECGLDWVVVGGESGPGARLLDERWIRSLVEQCRDAAVPIFVKQFGSAWASDWSVGGKTVAGHGDRKGGDPQYWPDDLRVRQYPSTDRTSAANPLPAGVHPSAPVELSPAPERVASVPSPLGGTDAFQTTTPAATREGGAR